MSLSYRHTWRIFDWLKLNLNKRSVSATARLGRVTHTRSTNGRSSTSIKLPGGFHWRRNSH